jgi:acyl-CoA thioesterase-1
MKMIRTVFCAFAWLLLCIQPTLAQSALIKIVILGDSLTSGYQLDPKAAFPIILEQKLKSAGYNAKVISMNLPGETMAGGFKRLPDVLRQKPDIVMVQLGINDALKGIDVNNVIYPSLNKIVSTLKVQEIGVMILGMKAPASVKSSYAKQFEKMYYLTSNHYRTSLYPNTLKGITGHSKLTLADGFHPNEKGTLTMVHNMYPTIEKLVKWRVKYLKYKESLEQ